MLQIRNLFCVGLLVLATSVQAEDGHEAWLRYAPLPPALAAQYSTLPHLIVAGTSPIEANAARELSTGLASILGTSFPIATTPTTPAIRLAISTGKQPADSFTITPTGPNLTISAPNPRGALYGAFRLLELIASAQPLPTQPLTSTPAAPIRWVNQWDNLDGSIERGYAGRSIFFDAGHVRPNLTRVSEYGRLLASIGINGLTINNVNSDLHTLEPARLAEFARVAAALRPWGVRMSLSVDLSSPQIVGGLPTFDPLDPAVIAWWASTIDSIYRLIPDFAGVVIKADSEGRAGPSQYHRTPAEAANALAKPLALHNGVVLYRAFVYNHHADWRDLKADRARAGYDNFAALDGHFLPNVIVQIKHGPIDFQVREPVSPLFAAMQHTATAVELQTTQEYTGQQRHMVYLAPMWQTALQTDLRANNRPSTVASIVEGQAFHQPAGGFVSVVNVGLDTNWLHHPLALANLYAFGRLAWNPNDPSTEIVDRWTRLTFGNDPQVATTVDALQNESWPAYESYTGNLGVGTLTDIVGPHFGPNPVSAERNGWGQWFRADATSVGMDRTTATGTGYIGQYPSQLAAQYESLATCPDDLLLFMHHVPYTHRLHSGETVIQHIDNAHYAGAATAATFPTRWQTLQGKIDPDRYQRVLDLLTYQAAHAIVWRDAITTFFLNLSHIPDTQDRVGHYPNRIEAESMQLEGYKPIPITPAETASGAHAVACTQAPCTLTTHPNRTGTYRIAVQYFDYRNAISTYELLLNNKPIAHWQATATLPPAVDHPLPDGETSTRFTTSPIVFHPSDTLILRATPAPATATHPAEPAPVDYLEFIPTTP